MMFWVLAAGLAAVDRVPDHMACRAVQTAGFHEFPPADNYQSVVFVNDVFDLRLNRVLTEGLDDGDVYLTLSTEKDLVELRCRQVAGAGRGRGLSCHDEPPAQFLLLNEKTLRFSRSAIGGWTFRSTRSDAEGDSIFVEIGQCDAVSDSTR